MNRRQLSAAALVAVLAVAGIAGAIGAFGPTSGPAGTPATPGPTDAPGETPTAEGTPTSQATGEETVLDYEGGKVSLRPIGGQFVRGTTDLDPGSTVTIRLRSTDPDQPFLLQSTATVGDDGGFEAPFDLSGFEPGTVFEVIVTHDSERLVTADGEIVESG